MLDDNQLDAATSIPAALPKYDNGTPVERLKPADVAGYFTAEEAVRAAIAEALSDGAVSGISCASTLTARLDDAQIDGVIAGRVFHRLTDRLTVCVLTLRNGFAVTGESACAAPENYDQAIGESNAFESAREKIWALEGYLLRERLHQRAIAIAALERA